MKTALSIAVIAVLFFLGLLVWRYLGERDLIEFHKRAWWTAYERVARGDKNVTTFSAFWDDLVESIRGHRITNHEVMHEHEQALKRLGFLMTNDFVLTNQVLTREFGSNFWLRLRDRFGTNRDSMWMYRFNGDRIHTTLPAKDFLEWERIFRECAARYASNVPPASVTNAAN